jgi:hypothetical protein
MDAKRNRITHVKETIIGFVSFYRTYVNCAFLVFFWVLIERFRYQIVLDLQDQASY